MLLKYISSIIFYVILLSSCVSRQNKNITYKTKTIIRTVVDTSFVTLKVKFNQPIYFQYVYHYFGKYPPLKSSQDSGAIGVIYLLKDSNFVSLGEIDSTHFLYDSKYFDNSLENYHGLLNKGEYMKFQFKLHSKHLPKSKPAIFYIRIRNLLTLKDLVIIGNRYQHKKHL